MLMAHVQVKNVPEEIHRELRELARLEGRSIRDLVLEAVVKELERRRFREQLATRQPVHLDRPAAGLLRELREDRERSVADALETPRGAD